jgi:hypothetical protein
MINSASSKVQQQSVSLVHLIINTLTYYIVDYFYSIGIMTIKGVTIMPRKSPYKIVLSPDEALELSTRASKYTLPYFKVVRAKMILLAEQGFSNDEIADRLDTRREIVSMWRKRFFEQRLDGLEERLRPGRPRAFPPRADHSG